MQIARSFSVRPLAVMFLSVAACALIGQASQAADICGKWEGTWEECGGRGGKVCATITKCDKCGCGTYRMCLTGTCHHVVPFIHDIKFCVVGQSCDRLLLEGKTTIAHITYKGSASCTNFVAEYCGHHHKGRICLNRCGCHTPPPVAVAPYGAPRPPLYGAAPPQAYAAPAYGAPAYGAPPAYAVPLSPPPPPYRGGF